MRSETELFINVLKNNGKSLTKTRELVFEALLNKEPQTVGDLYASLRGQLDRASLYRSLELFENLGIVQRLQIGWKYKIELSDTYNPHHHHITCTSCRVTIPTREDPSIETSIEFLAHEYGFSNANHQLEIRGICSNCQKNL